MKKYFAQCIANRIEAFWTNDSGIVWIDWILSNVHKDHKLIALDKAVEIENQNLFANQREIQKYKQSLTQQQEDYTSSRELEFSQGNLAWYTLIFRRFIFNT